MNNQPSSKAKILLVEDNQLTRESMVDWLNEAGYSVLQAADGLEAIDQFETGSPDLILLDLGIPKLDGLQVLKKITSDSPQTPVVIVSGRSDINSAIDAFKAGAWDYITKPIYSLGILERTIYNCLEQKRLREKVEEAESQYYNLIQNLPVIIFVLNKNMQLDFINNTSSTLLGYEPGEALDKPDWLIEHIFSEDREKVLQTLQGCFESRNPFSLDFRFKHKKGYLVYLMARSIPMRKEEGDSPPDKLEGIIMDVTERKFLDTVLVQKEKLNTLGAMSAELAHEMRNPLVSLGGFARLLKQKNPDAEEANIVLQESVRLENLLDRISNYLKPVDVERKKCLVNTILVFCVDMLSANFEKHSISHVLDLDNDIEPIFSDSDILTQVFINLLTHAVERVKKSGKILIKTSETKDYISVDVTLDPLSISVKNPELLFLPFEQEESDMSISVSYRMVKDIGGYMSYRQLDNSGIFTVMLPKGEQEDIPAEVQVREKTKSV